MVSYNNPTLDAIWIGRKTGVVGSGMDVDLEAQSSLCRLIVGA